MNSILGQALVLVGLAAAAFGLGAGMIAGYRQSRAGLRWTQAAAYVFAAAMLLANLVMVRALVGHDFSVSYVAEVGSRSSPLWVTLVSLWSSLGGSILFWGAVLGGYVGAFTYLNRARHREYVGYALAVMLAVGVFFTLLLAGPANPFNLQSPAPADGPGPNALLQNHILMAVHPPMLYLGYVGLTVPFGIALAAALRGKLGEGWLKTLRGWMLVPWTFLSIGMVLGAWWSYDVLGWGGYWAWDPVENASLLPWLAATGYLHASIVHERRRVLKVWTLSLIVVAFLLTMLGTFMTRSGVFNSVHAFSQSSIGPTFLVFITVALVFSLGALTGRAHLLESEGRIRSVVSRESAFLVNNLVLVTFTFTVLLGTIYPLVTEALSGAKVSVGEPYFNQMAVPLGLMLVFLMGIGPALPWGRPRPGAVVRGLALPGAAGVVSAGLFYALGVRHPLVALTFGACVFAAWATLRELARPVILRVRSRKQGLFTALRLSVAGNRRLYGGYVVHLAVIVVVAAIAASQSYKQVFEATLTPGQSMQLGGYDLTFQHLEEHQEPNRVAVVALFDLAKDGVHVARMEPALNHYATQREPVGSPDVRTMGVDDLYLTLMSFEPDGSRVVVKAFVNPMVSWIWWSQPVLVLGAAVSLWPRRKRQRVPALEEAEASVS